MSWITRSALRAGLALSAVAAMVGPTATATAAGAADDHYFKYYAVTSSYNGRPETLAEIATRFLDAPDRSSEIFELNNGRRQADGGILTDPARLRAGWVLILPWDAVGADVRYGELPGKKPRPGSTSPGSATGSPSTPSPARAKKAAKVPGQAPKPLKAGSDGRCATAAASSARSNWATLRLAADQVWPHSRGKGQLVAIIDSGVDGSLPSLTGHIAEGMDIISGSGRGDVDCLGTGTAMAGLVAAQPARNSSMSGVAPDSIVMPIRVVGTGPKAEAADGAAAISAAVSAGATVIALGSYVDVNDSGVSDAINKALTHDVVVVSGSETASGKDRAAAAFDPGSLRVGGIGVDGRIASKYRSGGVDVVAPGINVASVGITGAGDVSASGTQYAVALVAGAAALVRTAYPDLSAGEVAHRIEATADPMGDGQPDGQFGSGMINLPKSVTTVLPEEADAPPARKQTMASPTRRGDTSTLLVITVLVSAAAAVALAIRIRRLLRDRGDDQDADESYDPDEPPNDAPAVRRGPLPPATLPPAPQPRLAGPGSDPGDDEKETEVLPGQEPAAPARTTLMPPRAGVPGPADDKASAGARSTGAPSSHD
ncbi:S8 family serine peptidase [Actinoplanes sp. NPDC049265]|uniref:S8 family serine peptidase n=1 Tax=Actinoplanes sp. NPDC049265 TaxID=3363902 RepID=UPI003718C6DA